MSIGNPGLAVKGTIKPKDIYLWRWPKCSCLECQLYLYCVGSFGPQLERFGTIFLCLRLVRCGMAASNVRLHLLYEKSRLIVGAAEGCDLLLF
jgi:hypothetical protein